MISLVVVGDIYVELAAHTPRLPRPHQVVTGSGFSAQLGGRGAVQAVTAARLGAAVTFIGRVGTGPHAALARAQLEAEGIRTDHIVVDQSAPTGVLLRVTDPDSKSMGVLAPGANARLTASDVERGKAALDGADGLITQLGVPQAAVHAGLQLAQARKTRSVFKPSPFAPVPLAMLTLADVVTPNEEELRALALNVNLRDKPPQQMTVCTLGYKGAQWFRRDGDDMLTGRVPGFAVRAVDVSGAGDVFSAALAVALAEAQPLENAIRFANAAAALSTLARGSVAGIPQRAAVAAKAALPTT
jgi:ribokinase